MANKMITEPDWDNAPEGAEEFSPETPVKFNPAYWRRNRTEYRPDPRHINHAQGWMEFKDSVFPRTFIKRPTKDIGLSRHDAIQWCVNNLKEFTGLGIIGLGYPEGWTFTSENGDLLLCHTFHDPINKVDFEMARKPKVYIGDTPEQMRKGTTPWVPEVGEECDFFDVSAKCRVNWVRVIPLFFTDQVVVLQHYCSGNHFLMNFDEVKFRPLRTQEEIEREEGVKALAKILSQGVGDCEPDEYLAAAVWDAGYRLTKK